MARHKVVRGVSSKADELLLDFVAWLDDDSLELGLFGVMRIDSMDVVRFFADECGVANLAQMCVLGEDMAQDVRRQLGFGHFSGASRPTAGDRGDMGTSRKSYVLVIEMFTERRLGNFESTAEDLIAVKPSPAQVYFLGFAGNVLVRTKKKEIKEEMGNGLHSMDLHFYGLTLRFNLQHRWSQGG